MQYFEYEVLTLTRTGHRAGDVCWASDRHGRVASHCDLAPFLNKKGREGWHIVSQVTDERFGSQVILQREIADSDAANPSPSSLIQETPTQGKSDSDVSGLTAQVQALAGMVEQLVSLNQTSQVITALHGIENQLASGTSATLHCTAEQFSHLKGVLSGDIRQMEKTLAGSIASQTHQLVPVAVPSETRVVSLWDRLRVSILAPFAGSRLKPATP